MVSICTDGREVVQRGGGPAPKALAHELDVLPLDVLDHHDLLLRQQVQRQVRGGVPAYAHRLVK